MATAEFAPRIVIDGCNAEVVRLNQWLVNKHEKFIADFISKPRIRGWLFWREIYYESAECAESSWCGSVHDWPFERPEFRYRHRRDTWIGEVDEILKLAYRAEKEGSKVCLSEKEVRNIWPEA